MDPPKLGRGVTRRSPSPSTAPDFHLDKQRMSHSRLAPLARGKVFRSTKERGKHLLEEFNPLSHNCSMTLEMLLEAPLADD